MSELERGLIQRTIPTHVGRTAPTVQTPANFPDHPHARGENQQDGPEKSALGGPSPRTWGEPN